MICSELPHEPEEQVDIGNKAMFKSWIKGQAKWEKRIIPEFKSCDTLDMLDILSDPEKLLYLVSDCGLKEEKGGYGAVLGTLDDILITASGSTALAPEMNEAYGILAGTIILQGIIDVHKFKPTVDREIWIYCDNESLVNTIQKYRLQKLMV